MQALSKNIIATALLGMLSGAAITANAGGVTEVTADALGERHQVTVSFADLNLTSAEGQEALYFRISRAAEKVCGPSDLRSAGSLKQASRNADCYDKSVSDALARVNRTAVASID